MNTDTAPSGFQVWSHFFLEAGILIFTQVSLLLSMRADVINICAPDEVVVSQCFSHNLLLFFGIVGFVFIGRLLYAAIYTSVFWWGGYNPQRAKFGANHLVTLYVVLCVLLLWLFDVATMVAFLLDF